MYGGTSTIAVHPAHTLWQNLHSESGAFPGKQSWGGGNESKNPLNNDQKTLKGFPKSPLVLWVSFAQMVLQRGIYRSAKLGINQGFSVHKQSKWRLWQLVSGFLSFLMVHILLSTSVSDFQGTTLILHQTFPLSPLLLLLSGQITEVRADLSIKMFGLYYFFNLEPILSANPCLLFPKRVLYFESPLQILLMGRCEVKWLHGKGNLREQPPASMNQVSCSNLVATMISPSLIRSP